MKKNYLIIAFLVLLILGIIIYFVFNGTNQNNKGEGYQATRTRNQFE